MIIGILSVAVLAYFLGATAIPAIKYHGWSSFWEFPKMIILFVTGSLLFMAALSVAVGVLFVIASILFNMPLDVR